MTWKKAEMEEKLTEDSERESERRSQPFTEPGEVEYCHNKANFP